MSSFLIWFKIRLTILSEEEEMSWFFESCFLSNNTTNTALLEELKLVWVTHSFNVLERQQNPDMRFILCSRSSCSTACTGTCRRGWRTCPKRSVCGRFRESWRLWNANWGRPNVRWVWSGYFNVWGYRAGNNPAREFIRIIRMNY